MGRDGGASRREAVVTAVDERNRRLRESEWTKERDELEADGKIVVVPLVASLR